MAYNDRTHWNNQFLNVVHVEYHHIKWGFFSSTFVIISSCQRFSVVFMHKQYFQSYSNVNYG